MAAGKRDEKIEFQRNSPVETAHGGQQPNWNHHAYAWADINRGKGAERREAAQESASLPATFQVLANSATCRVNESEYRIKFNGYWDIISVAPNGRKFIDITAIRSSQGG